MSINKAGGFSPIAQYKPPTCNPEADGLFADAAGLRALAGMPQSPAPSAERQISMQARASQVQSRMETPPPSYDEVATCPQVPSAPPAPDDKDNNDRPKTDSRLKRFGHFCVEKLHAAWNGVCNGIAFAADKGGSACEKGRVACAESFSKNTGKRAALAGSGVLVCLVARAACGFGKYFTLGVKYVLPAMVVGLVLAIPVAAKVTYFGARMACKGVVKLCTVGAK